MFAFFLVFGSNQAFGFRQQLSGKFFLRGHYFFNLGTIFLEHLVFTLRHGTGYYKGSSGIVYEHGVHFVDYRVIVHPLHEFLRGGSHIVTQIVETEFVVRTESNVGIVSPAAFFRIWFVLVDAIHAKSVEHVQRPHPFGVALGQIIVHGNHVHAIAGKCVQEYRERGHEGFSFTGRHFGDVAFMQGHAAYELHVVVYHVPFHEIASGHPFVFIHRLVAVYGYEIVFHGKLAVKIVGRNHYGFRLLEPAGRIFHDGENLGQELVQCRLHVVQALILQLVDFGIDFLALVYIGFLDFRPQFRRFLFLCRRRAAYFITDFRQPVTQPVVVQCFYGRGCSVDFINVRTYGFEVVFGFCPENFADKGVEVHLYSVNMIFVLDFRFLLLPEG